MMNKSIFMAGCLNTSPHHQATNGKVIQFRYNRQGEALALQVRKSILLEQYLVLSRILISDHLRENLTLRSPILIPILYQI